MEKKKRDSSDNKKDFVVRNKNDIVSYSNHLLNNIEKTLFPQYIDLVSKIEEQSLKISNMIKDVIPKDYNQVLYNNLIPEKNIVDLMNNYYNSYYNFSKSIEKVMEYENNFVEKIIESQSTVSNSIEQLSKKLINNDYYETMKICLNEISKSKVVVNEIMFDKTFFDYTIKNELDDNIGEIEQFGNKDRDYTIRNVKEMIDIVEKKEGEYERQLYEKMNLIKKEHPLIARAIYEVFWIVVAIIIGFAFTKNANQIYIKNYINNMNIEESNNEFISNARYVNARKLIVRSGPGKNYNSIILLNWGTIVKVIDKVRYWTKIQYKNEETIIEGWVYSRYLEKFDAYFCTE